MNGTSGMPLYSWRLMDAHLNDSISAEEVQELESLLLANATVRQTFLEYSRIHAELHLLAAARNAAKEAAVKEGLIEEQPRPLALPASNSARPRRSERMKMRVRSRVNGLANVRPRIVSSPLLTATMWLVMFLCGGTLTCLLVFAGLLFRSGSGGAPADRPSDRPAMAQVPLQLPAPHRNEGGDSAARRVGDHARMVSGQVANLPSPDHAAHGARKGARDEGLHVASPSASPAVLPPPLRFAQLTRQARAQWADARHTYQLGDRFAAGQQLDLARGVVELRFDCGVQVVLQGPARVELASVVALRLQSGKMTAEILRPEARGFQVQTPRGNVIDLGTEFGVEVTPCQDVEVHVFRGEVVVERNADASAADPRPASGYPGRPGSHVFRNQGLRMESGTAGPLLVEEPGDTFIRTIDDADRDRHVVAYWRFEDHPVGEVVADTSGNTKPVRGTVDSSFNGNDLFTYSASTRPRFSGDVPADAVLRSGAPNRGCLDNTTPPVEGSPTRDLYTRSRVSHASPIDIQKVKLAQWTIEASVKAKVLNVGTQTFVGRDGGNGAVMAFRINPQDHFEICFKDVNRREHRAIANMAVQANQWYRLAAVCDGHLLQLYIDCGDGRGYQLRAVATVTPKRHGASTVLGPTNPNAEWSVGRGRVNRLTCEWFQGWIDEVRICDVALPPGELLFAPRGQEKQPDAMAAKTAAAQTRKGDCGAKPKAAQKTKTTVDGIASQGQSNHG